MRRSMAEILASQRKMLDRRGEDSGSLKDEQMAALFGKHLQSVEQWLSEQANIKVLDVHYSDMLADPLAQRDRQQRANPVAADAQAVGQQGRRQA